MSPLPTLPGGRAPDDDGRNLTPATLPAQPAPLVEPVTGGAWESSLTDVALPPLVLPQAPQRASGQPVAGAPATPKPRYLSVGQLTSEQLISARTNQYEHLQDLIIEITGWVQDTITRDHRTEEISEARREGGEKYDAAAGLLDHMILGHLSTRRDIPRGEDRAVLVAAVINEVLGLGPLEPLWADENITEIMANGPYDVQVEIKGKIVRVPGARFRDKTHLLALCERILAQIGRRVDIQSPIADGRLPDNSRVSVVHDAVAPSGPNLTIRRHRREAWTVEELVKRDALDSEMLKDLAFYVHSGCSSIVVGGTGAGKALALDTPIPTPLGMRTMGALKVGDFVFDEHGKPTKVTGVYPQPADRECFEVKFSDGTTVVVDGEHNWWVLDAQSEDTEAVVLTTAQIRNTISLPRGYEARYSVPVLSRPVRFQPTGSHAPFEASDRAYEILSDRSIKHISDNIKEAPVVQRLKFVTSILEHRSTYTEHRHVTYVDDRPQVLLDLQEILASLGSQSVIYGDSLCVSTYEMQRLSRWGTRRELSRHATHAVRHIVQIERVASVPTACITVDSPNHVYLCTKSYIPTHNTTVLNALSGLMPTDARLITIEDNLELQLHPDRLFAAPMEARVAAASGQGAVTIRDLVRAALRMRPDRIIVGEVRDAAAFDMLQAMNTGHAGSMTTIHANGADEAIPRLESLVAQAGELEPRGVLALIAGSVDLLIIVERFPEDGSRRVSGVYEVPSRVVLDPESGVLSLRPIPIWEFVHDSTDADTGKVIGHYEKKNEPSDILVRKHRLNRREPMTLEEIYEMSKVD